MPGRFLLAPVALAVLLGGSAWVAAQAAQPQWQVRELVRQSAARVQLVGSWFTMGSDEAELARARALCREAGSDCAPQQLDAETPARRVYVRSFDIDRAEVSNADYQRCVDAGRCLPARPSASAPLPEQPVVQVTWHEARDYCQFAGGDLPSEAQWEYAAHGNSQRSFPWGDVLAPELASFAGPFAELQAVTAFPKGRSFFGLLNLAGNAWELVLDRYVAPYPAATTSVDPVQLDGGTSGERVLRGGSFRSPAYMLRARFRAAIPEDVARADVGFRCAYAASRR